MGTSPQGSQRFLEVSNGSPRFFKVPKCFPRVPKGTLKYPRVDAMETKDSMDVHECLWIFINVYGCPCVSTDVRPSPGILRLLLHCPPPTAAMISPGNRSSLIN